MARKKKERFIAPSRPARMRPRQIADENIRLGDYLGFDEIDLHANMDGNITNVQIQRLGQIWWNKVLGVLVGVPLFLFFGGVFYGPSLRREPNGMYCLGLIFLIITLYIASEFRDIILLTLDIRNHQVRWVTGQAKFDYSLFRLTKELLVLDGVKFPATSPPFRLDGWYTVYYVPHSRTIISAEVSRPEDFEARLEQSVITMGADGEIEVG